MADKHAQSIEEIFPLIDFCRQGRLEEAREWAESGKPLDPPANVRRSPKRVPLLIAIEKGFFSLASLLIHHGAEGLSHVDALESAIFQDRPEVVRLLLDSKTVEHNSVEFSTVCGHGNAEIIKIFIEHGADLVDGLPVYQALINNPFAIARLCKELLGTNPEIQGQLDMVLIHHADQGSGKIIGLLIWAGAQPHVRIRDPRDPDGEMGECAIEAAVRRGDVAILKQMHPERYPDLIPNLAKTLYSHNSAMLDYLLGVGAVLNDKPNGGSSLVDRAFASLWFPEGASARELPQWISFLGSKGARWIPDEWRSIGEARRNFYRSPSLTFEVIKALLTSGVGQPDQIKELIRTAKIRGVLGGGGLRDMNLLLDPPKPKPPTLDPAAKAANVRKRRTLEFVLEEAEPRARTWLLDQLCENPGIRFWTQTVTAQVTAGEMSRLLGIDEESKRDPAPFFERAIQWAQKHLKKVNIQHTSEERSLRVEILLAPDTEWPEALDEAQTHKGQQTPYCLTSAASKLLAWSRDHKRSQAAIREVSLSHKLGMNGRLGHIDDLIHEIEAKTGLRLLEQKEGNRWQRGGAAYRFTAPRRHELPDGTKLAIDFDGQALAKENRNLRPYRRQIEEALLAAKPINDSLVFLFSAGTKAALCHSFPSFKKRSQYDVGLQDFFSRLKLPHVLKLYYDFRSESQVWYAAVRPLSTWEEALKEIQVTMERPSPSKLWGLTESASVLLEGLLELRTPEQPKRWIVQLSKEKCQEIGLRSELLGTNFRTWISILAEEICEMTPYRITTYPWNNHRDEDVCLHCRYKPSTEIT